MIPKSRNAGHFGPMPGRLTHDEWCVSCYRPDSGVVEHRSRVWVVGSHIETEAEWQITVTQRVADGRPERAAVDILNATSGALAHVAGLVAALSEAQALVDALNVGVPHREQVPA